MSSYINRICISKNHPSVRAEVDPLQRYLLSVASIVFITLLSVFDMEENVASLLACCLRCSKPEPRSLIISLLMWL